MNLSKEEILKQSLPILKLLEVSSCQLISFVQVSLKYGGVPRDHTNLGSIVRSKISFSTSKGCRTRISLTQIPKICKMLMRFTFTCSYLYNKKYIYNSFKID